MAVANLGVLRPAWLHVEREETKIRLTRVARDARMGQLTQPTVICGVRSAELIAGHGPHMTDWLPPARVVPLLPTPTALVREHHRWPYAPWWQLPLCRDLVRDAAKGPDSSSSSSSGVGAAKAGGKGAGADGEKEGCVLGGPMPSATSLRARQMAADCGVQDGEEGQGERKRGDVLAGDLAAAGAIAP